MLGKGPDLASVWGMCEEGRRGKPKGQMEPAVWKALHQSKGFRGIFSGWRNTRVRDTEKEANAEGALACMSTLAGTGLTCLCPITSCMDRPMAASSCKSLRRNES